MSTFDIKMPKLGESITEGTILSWSVRVGDAVSEDDVLFEVNSAKVSAEIPSPVAGKVVEILFKEGDTVAVGTVVARIALEGEASSETTTGASAPQAIAEPPQPAAATTSTESPNTAEVTPAATPIAEAVQEKAREVKGSVANPASDTAAPETPNPTETTAAASPTAAPKSATVKTQEARWYSPVVLQLAHEAGIGEEELEAMPGTGFEGRVTKKDIKQYTLSRTSGAKPAARADTAAEASAPAATPADTPKVPAAAAIATPPSATAVPPAGKRAETPANVSAPDVEIREMDYVRKIIADHMVLSKRTSPHVTNVVEADVTRLVKWREKNKEDFARREGVKLTYMPAITEAVTKALRDFPQVNVSVDGYNILYKKRINVSIAVSLDDGNLITPVIHDADRLNLSGLAVAIDTLAAKARAKKLTMDEMEGGTFTITNFGSFKSLFGTPIINQPQVAILGMGVIEKKPAVVETPDGDVIAIRHKMYLSLSYDHRVVDGSLGGNFLYAVKEYLENWPL